MTSYPQISVLMPVYKTAPYLREAIDSMLAQTFGDFELIVLNDGSPDEAEAIIDSYTDERIVRYTGKTNVGLANILNIGIDMARGKYIARMDSDDISLPNRLQVQFDYLEQHPDIDLVSVAMQQFGDGSKIMRYDNATEDIKFNALFFSPVLHASSMWRKERFASMRYEQDYVPAEDYRLWTQALLAGIHMRNLPDVLYLYRQYATQVTQDTERIYAIQHKAKYAYLQGIFPTADDAQLRQWCQLTVIEPDKRLACFGEMERLNNQKPFFEPLSFRRRYRRYYQSVLFEYMRTNGIVWNHLTRLRLPQIIKLLVHA